jgi:hypothetical protein
MNPMQSEPGGDMALLTSGVEIASTARVQGSSGGNGEQSLASALGKCIEESKILAVHEVHSVGGLGT